MTGYVGILGETSSARMVEGDIIYDVPLILTMSAVEYAEFVIKTQKGRVRVLLEREST